MVLGVGAGDWSFGAPTHSTVGARASGLDLRSTKCAPSPPLVLTRPCGAAHQRRQPASEREASPASLTARLSQCRRTSGLRESLVCWKVGRDWRVAPEGASARGEETG